MSSTVVQPRPDTTRADAVQPQTRKHPRRLIVAGAVIIAALVAGLAWLFVMRRPPSTTADPATLVKFVASSTFASLSSEEQARYRDALREGKDKVADAFKNQQFSASDMETARLNIWIARTQSYSQEFSLMSKSTAKERLLDRLIEKQESEFKQESKLNASAGNRRRTDPYDMGLVTNAVSSWPMQQQTQWNDLRQALEKRRLYRGLPAKGGVIY